jgi:hypothetical protein
MTCGKKSNAQIVLLEKSERDYLKDIGVDGKLILQRIVKE